METQIKQVQDYFKNKILNLDVILDLDSDNNLVLVVDAKYKFTFFTYEKFKDYFQPSISNFIELDFTEIELRFLNDHLRSEFLYLLKTKRIIHNRNEIIRLEKQIENEN